MPYTFTSAQLSILQAAYDAAMLRSQSNRGAFADAYQVLYDMISVDAPPPDIIDPESGQPVPSRIPGTDADGNVASGSEPVNQSGSECVR